MLKPGTFLQNRYEILEKIGSGGMSVVYKAKCHKLNRLVAIKVLNEEFSSDAGFVSKFKMEAQAAARLSHPNIVNVYDVVDEGELHYIVMELIEGITLKSYIAKKSRLSTKEAIGIAIQVAQGIAAAHEQNIIHRDIKPQNMIISKDGKVKVADFGIARAVSSQTINASAIGSVHYMAPEQARGGYSDARSDIYSLGITMYEMVTGRLPFEGENTVSVALSHLQDAVVPPHVYNPEVSGSLEQIILKCTKKRPDDRYSNISDLINDLRRALLHPDEDFAEHELDPLAQTMVIGAGDLAKIKSSSVDPMEIRQRPSGNKPQSPGNRAPKTHSSESRPVHGSQTRRPPVQEDVNHQFEKLLTGAGILVAVLIVAVLVFVFFRLGGIFNTGSGGRQATESVADGKTPLKDTEVYMPDVTDLPVDMAEQKLKDNFLTMKITGYEYSENVDKDQVIRQDPEGDTVVSKWSSVSVVVSQGSNKVDLSDLIPDNAQGEAVKAILEGKKFQVQMVEENSDEIEKGMLIRYEPKKALPEGMVTLYISKGPELTTVPTPALVGMTDEEAIALLIEAGLVPGNTGEVFSNSVPIGSVATQEIPADTMIAAGTTVNYTISKGPEESESSSETSEEAITETTAANAPRGKYVAAINKTYDVSSLIGPGSGSTSVQLMVRLKQHVNGKDVYKTLMDPKTVTGNNLLPIVYSQIDGAYGVDSGSVEVVDVQTGAVLKSYSIAFFEVY